MAQDAAGQRSGSTQIWKRKQLLLAFVGTSLLLLIFTMSRVYTTPIRSTLMIELVEAKRGFIKAFSRPLDLVNNSGSSSSSSSSSSNGSGSSQSPVLTKFIDSPVPENSSDSPALTNTSNDPALTNSIVKENGVSQIAGQCRIYPHVDFNGDALVYGETNLKDSAAECCDSCLQYNQQAKQGDKLCNVWVWCHDKEICGINYRKCWVKYLPRIRNQRPTKAGTDCGWTSGTSLDLDLTMTVSGMNVNMSAVYEDIVVVADKRNKQIVSSQPFRPYHFLVTTAGARVEWSLRIHYYHFRKQKARCIQTLGDKCEMGGFTRILHDIKPDPLMDEMPSILMDPLPEQVVDHRRYAVLNRPYAIMNWIKDAEERIPEKYIFMAEPDHVLLHPLPNLMRGDVPVGYPFNYIRPASRDNVPHIKRHTGLQDMKDIEEIAPIGSSPFLMTLDDMKKVIPVWQNVSVNVYKDKLANKAWGWVQEMFGFSMAVRMVGIREVDTPVYFMGQPPYSSALEGLVGWPYYIIHYTYGLDYNYDGTMLPRTIGEWHFDKRAQHDPISRNMTDIPPKAKNNMVRKLISSFNEATEAIPCWDDYVKQRGRVINKCDEPPKHFLASEWAQKI